MILKNKYTKFYYSLINKRKDESPEGIIENHHIIPKCLGGSNEVENIVKISPREHFVCHLLLTKMTIGEDKRKMHWALHRMAFSKTSKMSRKYTSREYDLARKIHSNFLKSYHPSKFNPNWIKSVSDGVTNSWKDDDKRREKFSKTMKENMSKWRSENSKEFVRNQKKASQASKFANCKQLEYKGKIYIGWSELERETGLNKAQYKYYQLGLNPFFRKGKNGPVSLEDIRYILSIVPPNIALEEQILTETQLRKGGGRYGTYSFNY